MAPAIAFRSFHPHVIPRVVFHPGHPPDAAASPIPQLPDAAVKPVRLWKAHTVSINQLPSHCTLVATFAPGRTANTRDAGRWGVASFRAVI